MNKTSIGWTDTTWNPTTGCTKISPGCANCYIETTPPFRMKGIKFVGGRIPLKLHADRLDAPLHWKKPRRVFVNSMSDLFHEDVPDSFVASVFQIDGGGVRRRGATAREAARAADAQPGDLRPVAAWVG